MKNVIRRFVPADPLDAAAMESWLGELAEDGLFLVSFGIGSSLAKKLENPMLGGTFGTVIASFESGEPRKAAYRLEPSKDAYLPPDEKKQAFFAEFGWEYVCPISDFHVYRAKTEDAPEIHTDPVGQAEAYAQIVRSTRNKGILLGILFVTLICILVFLPMSGFFSYAVLYHGTMLALCLAAILVCTIWVVRQSLRLRRIRNLLRDGTPLSHSKDYRRGKPWVILANTVVYALFAVFSISTLWRPSFAWEADWRDFPQPIPMVSLAEVEQDAGFVNGHIGGAGSGKPDSTFRFNRSFFAPEQVTITQNGYVPGRHWEAFSDPYDPSLEINIYRLRLPFMGAHFLDSLMALEQGDIFTWDTYDLTAGSGLDEAHLSIVGDPFGSSLKKLFLRQGNMVLYVDYFGEADLRPLVPQFAALMQETYPTKEPR